MNRFDLKEKKEYRFVAHPIKEYKHRQIKISTLIMQIYKNIEDRERKGVNQAETRDIMDRMLGINQKDEREDPMNNLPQYDDTGREA